MPATNTDIVMKKAEVDLLHARGTICRTQNILYYNMTWFKQAANSGWNFIEGS